MIRFKRYPHVGDLIEHYVEVLGREDIRILMGSGIGSEEEALAFSKFIWVMAEQVNEDQENSVRVLGSEDNTEMLPDVSYEITKYMKANGYYSLWEQVSDEEI